MDNLRMNDAAAAEFVAKAARLYLSSELAEDEPVEAVEVLDALITEARQLICEKPKDVDA